MLKITVLILTLYACGITANSIYRNEWHVPQEVPVNQHGYYSQYGPLFKELADYQQKVYQQGLAAVAYDQNPPFTLHHEYNGHPVAAVKPVNQGEYPLHNYYSVSETNKKNEKEKEIVAKKPEKHTDKHNADGVVVVVANNKKQQLGHLDNKHESNAISRLNETIHKIGDNIEDKFLSIKKYVENSVKVFNQAGDDMYQRIGNKTTSAFDKIHKNLEGIESQLHQLKPNNQQHEHSAAVAFSKPTIKPFYTSRYNFDRETPAANVVHSEQNKQHSLEQNNNYRSIDNIDLDAEMRTDIKSSITNAVQNAQEKLNKMIDDQVAKVNKKVNEFNQRLDAALLRFNDALSAIKNYQPKPTTATLYVTPSSTRTTTSTTPKYTKTTYKYDTLPTIKYTTTTTTPKPTTVNYYNRPTTKYITTSTPKYTINWTPKALTWKPTPKTVNFFDQFTTPEYYKYTVSTPKFLRTDTDDVELAESLGDTLKSNINRMDTVEALDNEEEGVMKAKDNEGLDDLAKSEILEDVDDKLKNEQVDADVVQEIIESDSSISIEDKLKIVEEDASEMEMALENELRNELKETVEDKLIDDADKDADSEKSLVDNVELQKMNPDEINVNNDDIAKNINEESVNEEESEPVENVDDSMKNIETDINDNNDNIDGNDDEVRTVLTDDANIIDDIEDVTMDNVDEESSIETNRFDELEVIQLIPVIIEQLRKGNVVEEEKVALQKIFGDLWELIVIEANRVNSVEEMNPLLKTLLQSEEVRLAKREIKKQIGNDIYKNSIRRIYRGDSKSNKKNNVPKPYIALDDDRKLLSPSERLLNMVAAIVHKTNVIEMAKSKKRRNFRQKKKQANKKHPLGIVTVQKPRQKYLNRILNINRMKRSLIKFGVDMHDMKALMDQVNSQENGDDDDDYYQDNNEKRHDESDYQNTDYYEDDYNYQEQEQERVEEIPTDDSYEDYSIDNFNMAYRRNNDGDDYENGSVVELINLAKQRDRREKIQHKADAEYEDEYDEVPVENEYGIDASAQIEY